MFFVKHKIVLTFFVTYYLLISFLAYWTKLHFVFSTILFIILPTAILILLNKNRNSIREFTLFCFSLGVPMGIYSQVIAERNNMWKYNPVLDSFYAFGMPLEAIFWYPAWFGLVVATYLYFFDHHKHIFKKDFFLRHFKYFVFVSILTVLSLFMIQAEKELMTFHLPYITVILPLLLLSLVILFARKHKHFLRIFIPTVLLLFFPMLLYDLVGVYGGQWTFPGSFLFQIDFGIARLPVEEFIIWLFIWPASVLAYFEEFENKV